MNFSNDALGAFNPQVDRDAGVRFALTIVLMEKRLTELSYLLTDGHETGGIGRDPGWIIERRDSGQSGIHPSYAEWPKDKQFHVHVDPTSFGLIHEDMYLTTKDFHSYVSKALSVYAAYYPADPNIEILRAQLKV